MVFVAMAAMISELEKNHFKMLLRNKIDIKKITDENVFDLLNSMVDRRGRRLSSNTKASILNTLKKNFSSKLCQITYKQSGEKPPKKVRYKGTNLYFDDLKKLKLFIKMLKIDDISTDKNFHRYTGYKDTLISMILVIKYNLHPRDIFKEIIFDDPIIKFLLNDRKNIDVSKRTINNQLKKIYCTVTGRIPPKTLGLNAFSNYPASNLSTESYYTE